MIIPLVPSVLNGAFYCNGHCYGSEQLKGNGGKVAHCFVKYKMCSFLRFLDDGEAMTGPYCVS